VGKEFRVNQAGENNRNWNGGRVIASNGYVLIRVGVDHHLADVRGYAYEHRLVAELKLGRRLLTGEQVHHKDANKTNNHPDNLEVFGSLAEHMVEHRTVGHGRRLPSEPNEVVQCLCGCGELFAKFDESGRPRRFVPGHNPPDRRVQDALLGFLSTGPKSVREIIKFTGRSQASVKSAVSKLAAKGVLSRVRHGVYRKSGS